MIADRQIDRNSVRISRCSNIKSIFSKISVERKAAYLQKKEKQINVKFLTDLDPRR